MQHTGQLTTREREVYQRGLKCFERGELKPALEAFSDLLQTRNSFADVYYMVGVMLESQDDLDGACDHLQRAIRINPRYAEALLALGTLYERRGDFDRSQELARRAVEVSRPANQVGQLDATTRGKLANMQAAVGDAYIEAGELREGIEAYRKALDRCPEFHDIRYRLGRSLREAGLPDQAILEFKRVQRGQPKFLDAQVQLGLTYYSLGRARDALEEWKGVLVQDPSHRDARMYLRMVEAAGEKTGPLG